MRKGKHSLLPLQGKDQARTHRTVCPSGKARLCLEGPDRAAGFWSRAKQKNLSGRTLLFPRNIGVDFLSQPEMAEKEKITTSSVKVTEREDKKERSVDREISNLHAAIRKVIAGELYSFQTLSLSLSLSLSLPVFSSYMIIRIALGLREDRRGRLSFCPLRQKQQCSLGSFIINSFNKYS